MNIFQVPILKAYTICRANNLPYKQLRNNRELTEEEKIIINKHIDKIRLLNRNLDPFALQRMIKLGINLAGLCAEAGLDYYLVTQRFHRKHDLDFGHIVKFKEIITKYFGE